MNPLTRMCISFAGGSLIASGDGLAGIALGLAVLFDIVWSRS